MNETLLASFRAELEKIRLAMIGEVKNKYNPAKDGTDEQTADIVDHAAQSYSKQLILEHGEQEWKKLRLVEEAIEKMDNGRFGICSECKEPISEARLKIIPFATHCIGCLDAIERGNS